MFPVGKYGLAALDQALLQCKLPFHLLLSRELQPALSGYLPCDSDVANRDCPCLTFLKVPFGLSEVLS